MQPSRNGKLLLDVLTAHKLRVQNGQTEDESHTTRHAAGAEPALLDLIITDTSIKCPSGARVLRELEIGSDHLIVEAIIAIPRRVLSQKKSVRTRWNRKNLLQMVEEARTAVEGEEDPQPTEYAQACSRRLAGCIQSASTTVTK